MVWSHLVGLNLNEWICGQRRDYSGESMKKSVLVKLTKEKKKKMAQIRSDEARSDGKPIPDFPL